MSRVLPILFNSDMVQSILDGRKTVTRRICKDVNDYSVPDMSFFDSDKRTYAVHSYADLQHTEKLSIAERACPICPGDILYVRETWAFMECINCDGDYRRPENDPPCYDTQAVEYDDGDSISDGCFIYRAGCRSPERITWRPSIHMPKEAARIWLKVTDVRVEKLQDIRNFRLEGIEVSKRCNECFVVCGECNPDESPIGCDNEVEIFAELWDSTVKKADITRYGWDANPWVWVIEFERCEKPESEG